MTDPVFPAGYTQGLVPGIVPNAYGTLPSLQDYITFVFTQNSEYIVNTQIGALGETLIAYRDASKLLNKIYALASNPAVAVDRNGSPETTTGNTAIANGAIAALFTAPNSLYSQLQAFIASNDPSIPASTKRTLQSVLDDLTTFQGNPKNPTFGGWVNWYGSVSVQDNLLNGLTAVQSLSNIAQGKFTEIMFIYETFVKGASSILSGVGQTTEDIAINIRPN